MPHQWCTSASSPHCHSAHVPPFPILSKGQPEVCAGVLMGKQHSPALLPLHRHLSLHIKAHAHSPFSLTLPPSLPLCLANDSEEQKLVDGLDRGGGKGRKKKKKHSIFFFYYFCIFFLNWAPREHSGLPRSARRLPAQLQGNKLLKALMGFCPRLFY